MEGSQPAHTSHVMDIVVVVVVVVLVIVNAAVVVVCTCACVVVPHGPVSWWGRFRP